LERREENRIKDFTGAGPGEEKEVALSSTGTRVTKNGTQ
jgi:hypothetical protein